MAITIYRGDDARLTGVVTDQDGATVDITGWAIVFSAAAVKGEAPIFQVNAVLDNPTVGSFYVDLAHATHTANVCTLYYDVQATTTAAKVYTLDLDTIEFVQEVTQ